ncbi:FGGY-family carbohydrate kinase [Sphingomonas sp. SUN039]|uniref:FGGY-family carbohydrate kinase n=1 Tax=Sphingomonas sp. SUN039 TaxID=2937787 RepID=UPI002164629F|nr:FGGY family carbohydrate kinase [Sphingomonas sp. SUN039]UVO54367.1 FGGY family carbohydrate kinase [Sphingomonas sp. SUN039]
MGDGCVIVVDVGKTLAKASVWTRDGRCLDRVTRPNEPVAGPGYAALDTAGVERWLEAALAGFAAHPVEAIIPVTHGAAFAVVSDDTLAFPPLDYEQSLPEAAAYDYAGQRDAFADTGSPALPAGLNLGAQLHWLEELHGDAFAGATLMPYAQYWAWWLSGVAVREVTTLGCHSDLWHPQANDWSMLAKRRGWAAQFAPVAKAGDAIGTVRPDLASRTGLSSQVRVHAGLHDSNAALLAARGFAEIADHEATVLSTGTWFVAMRLTGDATVLPEGRDCLVNVDPDARPVPSARWMGGREIETLIELDTRRVDIVPDQPALIAAVPDVLAADAMVLPTLAPGCGPFPQTGGGWHNRPDDWFARRAAACLYAALVTATSLDLIGTRERLLVEGRFADAQVFVRALASLRPDLVVYTANAHNDVSFGALRLIDPSLKPQGALARVAPLDVDLTAYSARWRERAA